MFKINATFLTYVLISLITLFNTNSFAILYCVGNGISDKSSNLYSVDNYASSPSANGLCELNKVFSDIAINHLTGIPYGISGGILYSINIENCTISEIGDTNLAGSNALDFSQDGELFVIGNSYKQLYKVDIETANITKIMDTGYTSGGDIAFDNNELLYLSTGSNLISINMITNDVINVGSFGVSGIYGLDFSSDGILYATQGSETTGLAAIFTIDKTTGLATKIDTIKDSIDFGNYGMSFTSFPNSCEVTDSDNDGVIDRWDNCINTPNNSYVDKNGCHITGLYTEEQMNNMVKAILLWGDLNNDNKIGLNEAIEALRITSGVTEPAIKK